MRGHLLFRLHLMVFSGPSTLDVANRPTYSMYNPALSSVKRQSSGLSVVNDT